MQSTLIEELMAAGRGVLGIIIGDRKAPGYFDFSLRGLAGSFIAFILVTALNLYLPKFLGVTFAPGEFTQSLIQVAIAYALQLGATYVVLNQLKRVDGLLPFMVADNWGSFFVTLALIAVVSAGITGVSLVVIFGLIVLLIEINNARLVLTLTPMQIAMFIVARLVGAALAFGLNALLFPVTAEQLSQVSLS